MIISKIEIQNFRSYYKENVFELVDGLNLIIGANGDGKTTFYEALEWLFRTDETKKMDVKYISKKRCEELFPGYSDNVHVSMYYEHDGKKKILEKSFKFTKSLDGEVSPSEPDFRLIEGIGSERMVKNGTSFDKDLSSDVRKYIMFKGEADLDIFQKSSALKMLVDTFSDVKDFEAYFAFMKYAVEKAQNARDVAQKSDRKNADKITVLKKKEQSEKGFLSDIERQIERKSSEAFNFSTLLKNIEQSKEASQLLKAVNRRIENLQTKRDSTKARIHEDYTINLLDNMWILLGFESIANEYSAKVSEFDKKRRKLEQDYLISETANHVITNMQKDFVPLPVHIPGRKIMEEMLDEEVCKICGRPAKKHTEAWEFMYHRLEEYKASLKVETDVKIPPYYVQNFIGELQKRDTILNDSLGEITKKRHEIMEVIAFNNRLHNDVRKFDANIESEFEQKKRILAQSDGLTEEQLLSNYENISKWTNQERDAEDAIKRLKEQREKHRAALEEAQTELTKIAKGTTAALYANTYDVISHISKAFQEAKDTNKSNLLHTIEDEANDFLDKLNIDDFKGTIRIKEKGKDEAEAVLINNDNTRIFNPNTALRTTYLMSVLFAIGKIASKKKENPYPLIFDAPTSSFTGKKESEFFNVIGLLDKQVIIVTKSFLKDKGNGELIIDNEKVSSLKGRIYRIEKMKPFDDRKLGTIQTVVTKIN